MFQADQFEVGSEAFYEEDGARFRVRVEGKEQKGDTMEVRLEVLGIERRPYHGADAPRIGELLVVSEAKDNDLNAGWTLSEN